ncbi:MAG: GGDEF domain-containing protein [Gammaproteobacteria bacterium]|nr:GGDEF domain-containing protein [Gammaproteobacteria bacterium]MBU1553173.1 GGDEF domain-containing protein [Gammaproteobacteria bacterium]MBU2071436.1 GGDEF domain-containing protein [Gammaproteobacteria bacterium]MBU2182448.1 GGDEF domain-containing protein [Gammaproteobacteria bacterium]MBU2204186.1 GGDEF domain-containing protein [Gammaproteobacteria bacterium]
MWRQHRYKILLSLLLLAGGLLLAINAGNAKPQIELDALDILGEGTTLLVACGWLVLIISSRPAGRVTEWLYYGSLLLVFSYFLDLLDEFIRYPEHVRLMSWLESLPAPVGMLVLTYGLVGWHREQRAINRQLRGRELFLRDHQLIDPLTQLYGMDYLLAVLQREIELHKSQHKALSLLVLDIDNFAGFNRRFGMAAGDAYLSRVSELLSNQLRHSDVVCRYAGDRFVALLPNTGLPQAQIMAQHLRQQLRQQLCAPDGAHDQPQLTVANIAVQQDSADSALQAADAALALAKQTAALNVQHA